MKPLFALFRFEMRLAMRSGGGALMGVIFFLAIVAVMPFAIGPDLKLLSRIGPAILWIGALLSTLLGLERLLKADHEDGALDLLRMSDVMLELVVFVKCLAHWMVTGLPLVVATPLFGLILNMEPQPIFTTAAMLLVGTPALTFLGAIGAGLTVGLRRGGLLLPILILPFAVPVLIFGVAASTAVGDIGGNFRTPFLLLAALSLFSLVLGPLATAWAIRLSED
ncbi:MAG: heme exporter protein CcmB [Rhizobiales bacterium]|nr:heme exporter protein CcmB [Hyphomicrobiales bacterium]